MFLKEIGKYFFITLSVCVLVVFQNCGSTSQENLKDLNDKNNNNNLSSYDFDKIGPQVLIAKAPAAYVSTSDANFEVLADDGNGIGVDRLEYKVDGETKWKSFQSLLYLKDLAVGSHKVYFRALDMKGNIGEEEMATWIVDTKLPTISFTSTPGNLIKVGTNAVFNIAVTDDSGRVSVKNCLLDDVVTPTCGASVTLSGLPAGYYTFSAQGVDAAGNVATAKYDFTVTNSDGTLAPPEFLVYPVSGYVKTPTTQLKLASIPVSGFVVTCTLDGVAKSCAPGQLLEFTLGEKIVGGVLKPYVFKAKISKNGKSAEKTIEWRVDTHAPVLTVSSPNKAFIETNDILLRFEVSDNAMVNIASISCTLDGNREDTCKPSENNYLNNIKGGDHVLKIVVKDVAGNESSKELKWSNPSCRLSDLSLRWPLNGTEGQDWMAFNYYDDDRATNSIRDFAGSRNNEARATDQSSSIVLSTGNALTIPTSAAKVFASEEGFVFDVVNGQKANTVYSAVAPSALGSCSRAANYVVIKHANGFYSRYAHLQDMPSTLVKGSTVAKGAFLGRLGMSGCVERPQVSYTTLNCSKVAIDPVDSRNTQGLNKNQRRFSFVNLILHEGTPTWDRMMNNPISITSIKKSKAASGVTLAGFLSGGIKTDYLILDLVKPDGKAYRLTGDRISHGAGAGRFFDIQSGALTSKGNYRFRLWQEKTNGSTVTKEMIQEFSFTVTD